MTISDDEQNPLKYFRNFVEIWNGIFTSFSKNSSSILFFNRCDRTRNDHVVYRYKIDCYFSRAYI